MRGAGYVVLAAALTACGRIAFDDVGAGSGSATDDGSLGTLDSSGDSASGACAKPACATNAFEIQCNGRCFSGCDEPVFAGVAFDRCTALGGFVASAHDQADLDCVLQIRGNWVGDAWSGYVQIDGQVAVNAGWGWMDGINTFTPTWSITEPDDFDGLESNQEQCAVMFTNGQQADIGCGSMAPFLCSL